VTPTIYRLRDYMQGKPAVPRNPRWRGVAHQHLLLEPLCQVCGGTKLLQVHHKKPFHLFPELELVLANLITLCEYRLCHFLYGHCLDWKQYNPRVVEHAAAARQMIAARLAA
jgi:5-methylcytosine-specific restriction protein A